MTVDYPIVNTGFSPGSTGELFLSRQSPLEGQHIIHLSVSIPVYGVQNNLVTTSPTVFSPSGINTHTGNPNRHIGSSPHTLSS